MNPFLKLSKVLWIALAATVLIHAIGFSVLIALTTLQREIVSHLKYAGIQKRLAVEALAYAQIIHAPTLGVEYPWLDIAVARDRLRGVATEIKENNERLFAATKSVGGAGAKRLQELWTGYNLDVQVQPWPGNYMTLQEPFFDSMVVFSGAACECY